MKIHEYQAKEIFRKYGVKVPEGRMVTSVEDAVAAAEQLGGKVWVVKAQIHAGGRGKGGGVKVAKSLEEVRDYAQQILGMQLVTHQTGPGGQKVRRLLIEQGIDIARELYLGAVVDRATATVSLIASSEGGMEIEQVAANTPEKILTEPIHPGAGLQGFQVRKLCFALGLNPAQIKKALPFFFGLYKVFTQEDCSLLEINPLVVTGDDEIIALDAKLNFEANAEFRHKEWEAMRDYDEEEPAEVEAKKFDLSYVKLDGNIGCMVNGAGLAMSTMDIIKHYGGEPANFLDVGGGATAENVKAAFKIILSDEHVQAILVNIFGGIMKCDVIAEGVISATREMHLSTPLVVRLQGTNVEKGRKMLAASGLDITPADTLADAAQKVVACLK